MLKPSSIGLGSFGINAIRENSRVKYRGFSVLLVCALIRDEILREFRSQENFTGEFPEICW